MKSTSPESGQRIRIGISACLLGEQVRFDGGHKRDTFLCDALQPYVDWVPVCPEVEMGLGVPRESLRLVEAGSGLRLVGRKSGSDHTRRIGEWSAARLHDLAPLDLCGFVFKRGSPSCGFQRVKVYRDGALQRSNGAGLFADALMKRFPNLPVEDEGRLNDPRLRENFISAVFAYRRWRQLADAGLSRSALMQFHARHKFLLMAHDQSGARSLGRLAAAAADYFTTFSQVMRRTPTRRNHTNVLQHLAGYFSDLLTAADRAELTHVIESYRTAVLPLVVPVTLIRHYVRRYGVEYLENQVYLHPHPPELKLLNEL